MHDFVALDVETANRNRYSICSIGMVKFKDGDILDTYYKLINPDESFSLENIRIHGIQEHEVITAPRFYNLSYEIERFIGGRPVVAHNATFDMGALKDNYNRYGLDIAPLKYACSYQLARAVRKNFYNYKLSTISNYYGIPLTHHDALSDARAAGLITSNFIHENRFVNLDQLVRFAGYPNYGVLGGNGFRKGRSR